MNDYEIKRLEVDFKSMIEKLKNGDLDEMYIALSNTQKILAEYSNRIFHEIMERWDEIQVNYNELYEEIKKLKGAKQDVK